MCGRGDNVGVVKGRCVDAGGDEARDVGHVDDEVAADLVGNLAHALVVDGAAIGRRAGDQDLGPVHEGILEKSVVVNDARLEIDAVGESLKVRRHGRDLPLGSLVAVRQVAAVRQVEAHDAVMGCMAAVSVMSWLAECGKREKQNSRLMMAW